MKNQIKVFFLGVLVAANSSNIQARIQTDVVDNNNSPNNNQEEEEQRRELQTFDYYDFQRDVCDNGIDGVLDLGPCDTTKFPICEDGKENICYNRKPSREHFHENHQPKYYIQYNRVMCYPNNYRGCSSCTPGRYCASEQRCILEEVGYPCARWF